MVFGRRKGQSEQKNFAESLHDLGPATQFNRLIPEFVGRLPMIATLEELDVAALMQILTEPKNALTKQYRKMFDMEGRNRFSRRRMRAVATKAMERKTGARGLRSIRRMSCLSPCTTSRHRLVLPRSLWTSRSLTATLTSVGIRNTRRDIAAHLPIDTSRARLQCPHLTLNTWR